MVVGGHIRLLVLVGSHSEVFDGFPGILGTSEEKSVGTSWAPECQLVQGNSLTTGSLDPGTGSSGEPQSSNGDLRNGEEAVVVGNGTDNNDGPLVVLGVFLVDVGVSHMTGDLAQRYRGAVDLGHEQSAQDHLVEFAVGAAGEEAIQLNEELNVNIVALGRLRFNGVPLVWARISCPFIPSQIPTFRFVSSNQQKRNSSGRREGRGWNRLE